MAEDAKALVDVVYKRPPLLAKLVSPVPPYVVPRAFVRLRVAIVVVPSRVGPDERTTDPVPVEDVTPVPPRATASVPDPAFPMFRDVMPEPSPVKVDADTVFDPARAP